MKKKLSEFIHPSSILIAFLFYIFFNFWKMDTSIIFLLDLEKNFKTKKYFHFLNFICTFFSQDCVNTPTIVKRKTEFINANNYYAKPV